MDNVQLIESARVIFDYLYLKDALQKADVIMGFGHFDEKIPLTCVNLYKNGYGEKVIFTGGIGAGTADLGMAEADYFADVWNRHLPQHKQNMLVENQSTNTGENMRFTMQLWQTHVGFKPKKKALIVANAYRQLRVWATCQWYMPEIEWINCPPTTDFGAERKMFEQKGEDFILHLVGETERVFSYPEKGFMAKVNIPDKVKLAYESIKKRLM